MHKFKSLLVSLTLVTATSPGLFAQAVVAAPADIVKAGVGYDYSRGDYGYISDTEVQSTSLHLSHESQRWLFRAVFPYVTVKGPASVVSSGGPVFAAPPRPIRSYQSGWGDIVAAGTFHANPSADNWNVDLTGRVKFGTADEGKGLGTGKTDYYAQADFYRRFGSVTPFATIGYRFLTDSATYQLRDGVYASAGGSFRVSDPTAIGLSVDWRSRIVAGGEQAFESTFFVSHNPTDRWNLVGYVLKGFTDASADVGVGGLVSYRRERACEKSGTPACSAESPFSHAHAFQCSRFSGSHPAGREREPASWTRRPAQFCG